MKLFFSHFIVLALGVLIGGTYIWISSHLEVSKQFKNPIGLEEVLKYSNTQIKKNNFSCEGEFKKTVGAIVGSIFDINNQNVRNMVSFNCFDHTCVLSISNCKPWQSQECGSRHLNFKINSKKEIDPASFNCIDVP